MQGAPRQTPFTFEDPGGYRIYVYQWLPDPETPPKAVVIIAHGMAEHAGRHGRLAERLTEAGYSVYAPDHRGHGRTAQSREDLGYLGEDGFRAAVADLRQLHQIVKQKHPELSVFLLGHSMGSFLVQHYIYRYGGDLQGALLSGTCGDRGLALYGGILLAKLIMRLKGPQSPSPFLQNLSFMGYNNGIRPRRTQFDWLSRDAAEVDRYLADPLCGTICSAAFFHDLYRGLHDIRQRKNRRLIPSKIPLYLFSGDQDPVGSYTRTVRRLISTYRKLGLWDVTHRFYPGGRHEMLHETNREEVIADLITWLDRHVPATH